MATYAFCSPKPSCIIVIFLSNYNFIIYFSPVFVNTFQWLLVIFLKIKAVECSRFLLHPVTLFLSIEQKCLLIRKQKAGKQLWMISYSLQGIRNFFWGNSGRSDRKVLPGGCGNRKWHEMVLADLMQCAVNRASSSRKNCRVMTETRELI